jgi:hypothetical protein
MLGLDQPSPENWGAMSSARFGIIRVLPDGIPQWIEAIGGLAETKARVVRLASRQSGEFFIYSEKTGDIVEHFICSDSQIEVSDYEESACSPLPRPHQFLN